MSSLPASTSQSRPVNGRFSSVHKWPVLGVARGAAALNPLAAPAGTQLKIDTRVSNLNSRPFPAQATHGRRFVRLGAQLCGPDGAVAARDHARAWLPQTLKPATTADIPIELPIPDKPGHYAVKFDLVYEGIDWFEKCGSETTTKPLVVW